MMKNPEDDFIELGNTGYVPVRDGVLDLGTGEVIEYDNSEDTSEKDPDSEEIDTP